LGSRRLLRRKTPLCSLGINTDPPRHRPAKADDRHQSRGLRTGPSWLPLHYFRSAVRASACAPPGHPATLTTSSVAPTPSPSSTAATASHRQQITNAPPPGSKNPSSSFCRQIGVYLLGDHATDAPSWASKRAVRAVISSRRTMYCTVRRTVHPDAD
jgi:hypothetical protein